MSNDNPKENRPSEAWSDEHRGLYRKYEINRTDGSSAPGGKHEACEYFVLDLKHDKYAFNALQAYALACREEFPLLASDLLRRSVGERSDDLSRAQNACAGGPWESSGRHILSDRCVTCGLVRGDHRHLFGPPAPCSNEALPEPHPEWHLCDCLDMTAHELRNEIVALKSKLAPRPDEASPGPFQRPAHPAFPEFWNQASAWVNARKEFAHGRPAEIDDAILSLASLIGECRDAPRPDKAWWAAREKKLVDIAERNKATAERLRTAAHAVWMSAIQVANDPSMHLVGTSLLRDLDRAMGSPVADVPRPDSATSDPVVEAFENPPKPSARLRALMQPKTVTCAEMNGGLVYKARKAGLNEPHRQCPDCGEFCGCVRPETAPVAVCTYVDGDRRCVLPSNHERVGYLDGHRLEHIIPRSETATSKDVVEEIALFVAAENWESGGMPIASRDLADAIRERFGARCLQNPSPVPTGGDSHGR